MVGMTTPSDAGSSGARVPGNDDVGSGGLPWLGSPARRRALLEYNFTGALSGLSFVIAAVVWSNPGFRKGDAGPGIGASVVFLTLLSIAYIQLTLACIRYEERGVAIARGEFGGAIGELPEMPNFVDLLKLYQKEMDQYQAVTVYQVQNAYWNSQIAMALGLLIIKVDAVAVIVLKNSTSKFVLAGIGVAGTDSPHI